MKDPDGVLPFRCGTKSAVPRIYEAVRREATEKNEVKNSN